MLEPDAWALIPALPLSSHVTSGKLPHLTACLVICKTGKYLHQRADVMAKRVLGQVHGTVPSMEEE